MALERKQIAPLILILLILAAMFLFSPFTISQKLKYHASYLFQDIIPNHPDDFEIESANSTVFDSIDRKNNHSLNNTSQHVSAIINAEKWLTEHYNSTDIKDFKKKHVKDTMSWNEYRLGDMFRLPDVNESNMGYRYHKSHFPDSIAVEYMERANFVPCKWPILNSIIDNKTIEYAAKDEEFRKILHSLNRTLTVHLRTGDVIDRSKSTRFF